jgi:hypothetical protein
MHIFILDYYGRRFGRTDWVSHSELKAADFYRRFMVHKSVEEFNSPTYYGVDMAALTMLRRFAGSEKTKNYADEILAEMWREVADFYHPGLKNVAGPYLRAYGLDMGQYTALLGNLMFEALGEETAPYPKLILPGEGPRDFEMGHDIYDAFWSVTIGSQIPGECIPSLLKFKGPHGVRKITGSGSVATAWLDNSYMMGALYGEARIWNQVHPLVMHWKNGDRINTLRLTFAAEKGELVSGRTGRVDIDAAVNGNKADISASRIPGEDGSKTGLCLEIKSGNPKSIVYSGGVLEAEGLKMRIGGSGWSAKLNRCGDDTVTIPLTFAALPSGMETLLLNIEVIGV